MYIYVYYVYDERSPGFSRGPGRPHHPGSPLTSVFRRSTRPRTVAAARSNTPSPFFPPYCSTPSACSPVTESFTFVWPAYTGRSRWTFIYIYVIYTHSATKFVARKGWFSQVYGRRSPTPLLYSYIVVFPLILDIYIYMYVYSLYCLYIAYTNALYTTKSSRPDKLRTQFMYMYTIYIYTYYIYLKQTHPIVVQCAAARTENDHGTGRF